MTEKKLKLNDVELTLNVVELLGVVLILAVAIVWQLVVRELPCPLCFLQRIGFLLVAFGFLLNVRFGVHSRHYAIVIIGALFTGAVALRQIAIHIVPGTGEYGSAFLGLHLYTWCFIVAAILIIIAAFELLVGRQSGHSLTNSVGWNYIAHALFAIVTILVAANLVGIVLECGFFSTCPESPIRYLLLGS